MKYILEQNYSNFALVGKKAETLIKLDKIIDNFPKFFILSKDAFSPEEQDMVKEEAKEEINQKLKFYSDNSFFLLMASYKDEKKDLEKIPAKKSEIFEKLEDLFINSKNEDYSNLKSIVIQKMILSEKAGVSYSVNPRNSNIKEMLISAVYGLGINLNIEEDKMDSYIISGDEINKTIERKLNYYKIEQNEVILKKVDKKEQKKQVIPKEQILQIKEIVEKVTDYFGRFQKVEFVIEGEKITVIDSYPITNLISPQNNKIKESYKETGNILKSYEGITTPLTFSFIKVIYEDMYYELCKLFNVEKEKIDINSKKLNNILALIDGKVYYNVEEWNERLEIFPELEKNRINVIPIIGIEDYSNSALLPVVREVTLKEKIQKLKEQYDIRAKTKKVKKVTDKFNSRFNEVINKRNIKEMSLEELKDYYLEIERKIFSKWDAPLLNDYLSNIYKTKLEEQCIKYFGDEGTQIRNDLLSRENGLITIDISQRIKELAEHARYDKSLLRLLDKNDPIAIKRNLIQYSEFYDKLNEYLDLYSDRCLNELKLESKNLREDPLPLYKAITSLARKMKDEKIEYVNYSLINAQAEAKLETITKSKKNKFDNILKTARTTSENKERLRYERSKIFGKVRDLFLRIGLILTSMDCLEDKYDIIYLEVDEVIDFISGKSATSNLKELVDIRKKQYRKFKKEQPIEENKEIGEIKGTTIVPGNVKGKAKIANNIENIKEGDILVSKYTNQDWVLAYPCADAILLESNDQSQDAVIIAKEFNIPTIIGINNITDKIKTGDKLEIDTESGIIKK